MPELPEVETIKRGLEKKLKGLEISDIEIRNLKTFAGDPKSIIGMNVTDVWRKAKVLGIDLVSPQSSAISYQKKTKKSLKSEDLSLMTVLFHLKMTGQLIYDDGKRRLSGGHPTKDMRDQMPNKSTRVIFIFNDNSKLYFNDQRKFGWIKLAHSSQLMTHSFLNNLGPEPLEKEFTVEVLKAQLQRRKKTAVKVAILDQMIVSGIGNIYASEACFLAGIDPRVKVEELKDPQIKKLHQGIIQTLSDGVKYGGSSRAHYVNSEGGKGNFLDYAYVYNRKGEPCKKCKTIIEKITLGGRGTFLCPKCQK